KRFNNGFTAYAIHWINGELLKFVTRKRASVPGRRTEHGKHVPHAGSIEYFGNVAVGVGTIETDTSLNVPVGGLDSGDEEDRSADAADNVADLSINWSEFRLERCFRYLDDRERFILEARMFEGRTRKEIGEALGLVVDSAIRGTDGRFYVPAPMEVLDGRYY